MKDHVHHEGIQQTKYEAVFGTETKFRAEKLTYSIKTLKRSKGSGQPGESYNLS
jgi:hypothetical protein